jgi:hypothetical protein
MILKIVTHGRHVQRLAAKSRWGSGARYTNLRDVRERHAVAFIDIDWKNYSLVHHLAAVKKVRPFMTVMRDVESEDDFARTVRASAQFLNWSRYVIIVPKFRKWRSKFERLLTERHIVGYSVPTRYGGTSIDLRSIGHPVHLLGGRPDRQRELAAQGNVVSIDCNRFTLDASYGDYFDGVKYNYERLLSYDECLSRSMRGIDFAWSSYVSDDAKKMHSEWRRFRLRREFLGSLSQMRMGLKAKLVSSFDTESTTAVPSA